MLRLDQLQAGEACIRGSELPVTATNSLRWEPRLTKWRDRPHSIVVLRQSQGRQVGPVASVVRERDDAADLYSRTQRSAEGQLDGGYKVGPRHYLLTDRLERTNTLYAGAVR